MAIIKTHAWALLLVLMGCWGTQQDLKDACDPVEAIDVRLGFYRIDAEGNLQAIDTSFSSVYARGTRAELRNRRIDNIFYLPVPAKGGEVVYVFDQDGQQETVALHFTLEAYFTDTNCAPELRVRALQVEPGKTTIPVDRISTEIATYTPYESTLRILLP